MQNPSRYQTPLTVQLSDIITKCYVSIQVVIHTLVNGLESLTQCLKRVKKFAIPF